MLKIKQLMPEGYCLECRGCCRFKDSQSVWSPRLLEEEKKQIGGISVLAHEPGGDFVCSHLSVQNNTCRIYNLRPFECRLYPLLLSRRDDKRFLAVDTNCPYVKENMDTDAFKSYWLQMAELIKSPAFSGVLKNNPQMFQPYSGVSELTELDF